MKRKLNPKKSNGDETGPNKQKRRIYTGRLAGRHKWALDDAVIKERTAFGRTICALECGDLVNQGCHPETTPLLLWNNEKTAPLELLERSHRKPITHPDIAQDKGVCSRLQNLDEKWYLQQSKSGSTDIEKVRRMKGVARQTAVFGVTTLYIPPGIETVMKGVFTNSTYLLCTSGKYAFGSNHAMPPAAGVKMKLEQKVVLRGQSGSRVLQSRGNTILRKLRADADAGAFVIKDFLSELRRMVRARLVYAEFLAIPIDLTTTNATAKKSSRPQWNKNVFGLSLCFLLDKRGRFFGQFRFDHCELKVNPPKHERSSFGERIWLCATVPPDSAIRYSQHACACIL